MTLCTVAPRLLPLCTLAAALIVGIVSAEAAPSACPANAVHIHPGANIQNIVKAHGPGASFCLAPGEYRLQSIKPKRNQKFFGEGKAVLNGSRRLTKFHREGALWYAAGQKQRGFRNAGEHCLAKHPGCDRPEALFINSKPLRSVTEKSEVTSRTFFFDYAQSRIYLAVNPSGKKIEASVQPYAFLGGPDGVVIDGLTVEKYSAPIQFSAIGYNKPSRHWKARNNIIRLNYGLGVGVGAHSIISGNDIYDNGEMGIGCNGKNVLIEDNEIARNGFFAGLDPAWEGGGGKCVLTDGLRFRRNYSHHNNSYGFWTDIDNINTTYEDNRIEHNANGGISHEISYAAVIRNNTFKGNGQSFNVWLWGSAILVQNSRDVEIYGNHVEIVHAGNGISLIQQDRGSGAFGAHDTVHNNIHHNTIISREKDVGAWGAVADHNPAVMKAGHNRIDHNTYRVHDRDNDQWAWVDGFYDFATYRQKSGQDKSSVLVVDPK